MNTSYIFLAAGFEEIEALTVLDVMRRAGMDVKTVSITSENNVTGAHGIPVKADLKYHEVDFITPEWLIIPGGMPGAENLSKFGPLNTLLVNQAVPPLLWCLPRLEYLTEKKRHAIPASKARWPVPCDATPP